MIRYKRQRNDFSCAPLALYNVLKKYGHTISVEKLGHLMGTDIDGTWMTHLTEVAKQYFPRRTRREEPRPWTDGRSYLASVMDYSGDHHLVALVDSTDKAVYVANWYTTKNKMTHAWIKWETLYKYWDGYALRIEGDHGKANIT